MIPWIIFALESPALAQSTNILIGDGIELKASWIEGHYPGKSGQITLEIDRGTSIKRYQVPLQPDSWPQYDAKYRPAVVLSAYPSHVAIMDVTVAIESGVYGYNRVTSYLIDPKSKIVMSRLGEPIEFSDFGSWTRKSANELDYWDAVFNEESAHQAPHLYKLTSIKQVGQKNKITSSRTTQKYYEVNWSPSPNAKDLRIKPDRDPLRELGEVWRWWGEKNDNKN